jgi:choline dehydrogenase-like flavoprotein
VVVVGSGAGGGVVAGELAERGRSVLLLEAGPHRSAADHVRWEAQANHDLWWPIAFAEPPGPDQPPVPLFRGRCVGGTTTINTKVALRPTAEDYEKWHAASGILGDGGEPFAAGDLDRWFDRVEQRLGVRERSDWQQCIETVRPGFDALGAPLEPVMSYTDENCMRCGSCLQGCPTNAGKSSLNTYIQPAIVSSGLVLRAGCDVRGVIFEDRGGRAEAAGVEYVDGDGRSHRARAGVVVVAAGALATPGLLLRSGIRSAAGGSASSALIGRNLGFHAARLIAGLFDEIQDAHMVYPISAHCMSFQRDADGGFLVEASTIQDPIGFATGLCDEQGLPMWGEALVEVTRRYRYVSSVLTMINDENTGTAWVDESGRDRYSYAWSERERERLDASLQFAREALLAAGARRVLPTGVLSTHVQGSCRMGSDPDRSAVDAHGESHDVARLFVGDSSVIPRTLSVNPSLTIMALASRLAAHIDRDERGYLAAAGRASHAPERAAA